jgi:hypothetical protein
LQPSLLATSLDDVQPRSGHAEPRLWVRRLVIWRAQGEVIRDIHLKTGLNVIWSPDSGQPGDPVGHGGGKTSFCRLIRYCLGENSFGSQIQKQMIATKFLDGYVGAEVMLDGEQWVVIRPIGIGKIHHCSIGGDLDHIAFNEMPNTGLGPLRQAITKLIMADAASNMPVANKAEDGWEAALAWLTRDQECRLRDALDWRAPQTQSQSPSRQLSEADRLIVVRLLINALQANEQTATSTYNRRAREIESTKDARKRLENLIADLRSGLEQQFGDETGVEAVQMDLWAERSAKKLAQTEADFDPLILDKLKGVRAKQRTLEGLLKKADIEIGTINGRVAERADLKRRLESKAEKAHIHFLDATNPICQECGQPMPAVAVTFAEERRKERDDADREATSILGDVEALESGKRALEADVKAYADELKTIVEAVSALEQALQSQSLELSQAKGHVMMTQRFVAHQADFGAKGEAIEQMMQQQGLLSDEIRDLRRASAEQITRLSNHFDAILRFLVPEKLQGDIVLDQRGLQLRPKMSGDLTTAAIDSLKIVAFDLATLLLTIEGKTQLPGFLMHDSPREADLGLSIYNRLFMLIEKMESLGPAPMFQYIVTTTTAPPEVYRTMPWMRLQLHGAPAEQRLFKEDL